jgi:hypothetical protein
LSRDGATLVCHAGAQQPQKLEWIDLFALTAWGTTKRFGRKIVLNAGRGDF